MAISTMIWMVALVCLVDLSSGSGEVDVWKVGRLEFAEKHCKNKADLKANLKASPVSDGDLDKAFQTSGLLPLLAELKPYDDNFKDAEKNDLIKLYTNVVCTMDPLYSIGQAFLAAGGDVCTGDTAEITGCLTKLCDHASALAKEVASAGDNLTPEEMSEFIDSFMRITLSLDDIQDAIQQLESKLSGQGTDRSAEEYMEKSCPSGKELGSELKLKSFPASSSVDARVQITREAGLGNTLGDLKIHLDKILSEDKDKAMAYLKQAWEEIVCTAVPFNAVIDSIFEKGQGSCLPYGIDLDSEEAVTDCLEQSVRKLEVDLPKMAAKTDASPNDLAVSALHVWNNISNLQQGIAKLLKLKSEKD